MKSYILSKVLILLAICTAVISCTDESGDEITYDKEIVVGKTDYKQGHYVDYSPDLVLYAKADMNNNNYQENIDSYTFEFGQNNAIELQLYSMCDIDGGYWNKELVLSAVEQNICVTDTNSAHVRFFDIGEIVSANNSWGRNTSAYFEPADLTYEFQNDAVSFERNSDIRNKYLCFKYPINGIETFQWIQISTYDLDSIVIHDAYSSY